MRKNTAFVAAVLTLALLFTTCFTACGNAADTASSGPAASGTSNKEAKVNFVKTLPERDESKWGEWEKRASQTEIFMRENFMGEYNMFANMYPVSKAKDNEGFHYWIQAQMLDNIVDAYIRTGDKSYAEQGKKLIAAVKKRNGNRMTNDFYDDMGWMANAMLRLYNATGDEDLMPDILVLYQYIMDSWNTRDGGIAWKRDMLYYRNSPSNGPACILACRLYELTKEQKYLDMALKIFEWWDKTLVDPGTGLVWDGISRENDDNIDKSWVFTYCQGVYIGSCAELYKITGEGKYIDLATRTTDYTIENLLGYEGVLQDEGSGDGGAFKGIFCRYLNLLITTTEVNRHKYCEFLIHNGEWLWENKFSDEKPLFSSMWSKNKSRESTELHVQTSAIALLECLSDLYIKGYIGEPDAPF